MTHTANEIDDPRTVHSAIGPEIPYAPADGFDWRRHTHAIEISGADRATRATAYFVSYRDMRTHYAELAQIETITLRAFAIHTK